MTRLIGSFGPGQVESYFDNLVGWPENRRTHGDKPGVRGDIDEPGDGFRRHLDIKALRSPGQNAPGVARPLANNASSSRRSCSAHDRGNAFASPMIPSPVFP